jgi:hypothetical protein
MSRLDRLTVAVAFTLVAAFAFFLGCKVEHFSHQAVLTVGCTYGTWLVLTLASFFWLQPKQGLGCVISMFASVATYCMLMCCFADHFSLRVQYLSGSMFGGWFLVAATVISWSMRNDRRKLARSVC